MHVSPLPLPPPAASCSGCTVEMELCHRVLPRCANNASLSVSPLPLFAHIRPAAQIASILQRGLRAWLPLTCPAEVTGEPVGEADVLGSERPASEPRVRCPEAELAPEERVVETDGNGQKGTGREMVGGGRSAF